MIASMKVQDDKGGKKNRQKGGQFAAFERFKTPLGLDESSLVPGPSSLGAKRFRFRVSINHPLGFNWHPLEGAGSNYFYLT